MTAGNELGHVVIALRGSERGIDGGAEDGKVVAVPNEPVFAGAGTGVVAAAGIHLVVEGLSVDRGFDGLDMASEAQIDVAPALHDGTCERLVVP